MKKRLMLVLVSVMTMMLLLASCGEATSLGVVISDDMRSASITADKATDDDFVSAGTLTIGEDEKIVIDQHLEGDGSIVVRFVPADAEALSDPAIGTDLAKLRALTDEQTEIQDKLSGLYDEWEQLSENSD